MDGSIQIVVKKEFASLADDRHTDELIVPDVTSSSDDSFDDSDGDVAIKIEPEETPDSMETCDELENPYICFECGVDCESQSGLIDHFERTHTEEATHPQNMEGDSCREINDSVHDPLAGDVAPNSPHFEKTTKVEGAQNRVPPADVLLLYCCPCCAHSTTDWENLAKHMEIHVRMTYLACSSCLYKFSSSYPLKEYSGRDSRDTPHVCGHCPFKTQHLQALKDHCVSHHLGENDTCNAVGKEQIISTVGSKNHQNFPIGNYLSPYPSNQDQGNHFLLSDQRGFYNIDALSVTRKQENLPSLIRKSEPPSVTSGHVIAAEIPLLPRVSRSRSLAPKLPGSEVLGSVPKVFTERVPHETALEPIEYPARTPISLSQVPSRPARKKPCPYCSHVARDAHSLKTHILVHTKEKPFACELCSYRATQKAHLQKHMRVHIFGNRRGKRF